MPDSLQALDEAIFFFVNRTLANPVLDWLMPVITTQENWYPIFLVVYVWLWWKGGPRGRVAAVLIIPVIILSDQISASLMKPYFARTRPCVALENVNMLIGLKTSFSFPSSHAANSAAATALFAIFYPRHTWPLAIIAVLISFSRVYVGVHYPFDVLVGAVLGVLCALVVTGSYRLLAPRIGAPLVLPARSRQAAAS